jgi:hypothetical protein
MGSAHNSLRSDKGASISIFCHAQTAAHQRNSVSKAPSKTTSTATSKTAATNMFDVYA